MTTEHDLRLVFLAGLICLVSSCAAMALLGRAVDRSRKERLLWTSRAGVVAGCGIWSTHSIAMIGFRPGIPAAYSAPETVLSLIVAIVMTGLAFWIAVSRSPIAGGILAGIAAATMHFISMAGVRMQADQRWHLPLAIGAIIIGMVCAAAAVNLAVRKHSLASRMIAASVFAFGIFGLHLTAMAAITLTPNPTIELGNELTERFIAVVVSAISVIILLAALGSYVVIRLRTYIAELEQAQAELQGSTRDLEEALNAAARASQAKSQFLATMSHELRTPLNAVIGFSELLSEEIFGPLTPVYKDYASTIRDSGRHLLGIINDVLDVSKLDADKLELREDTVSVEAVVEECLRIMAQPASVGNVALESDLEANLPGLWADEQRIRQVIFNLVSNAVKFTLSGGTVRIAAFSRDGSLMIRIADNGIGMRPEDIPTALERFGQVDNTLSRRTEGTGLGLPLAKRLVELHKGTFVLDSAVGVGTSITMTFPPERIVQVEPEAEDAAEPLLVSALDSAAA